MEETTVKRLIMLAEGALAALASLWGRFDAAYQFLFLAIIFESSTATLISLSSVKLTKGKRIRVVRGVYKKIAVAMFMLMVAVVEKYLHIPDITRGIATVYAIHITLDAVEHLGELGVWLPKSFKRLLTQRAELIEGIIGDGKEDDNAK